MTWLIAQVQCTLKLELNYYNRLDGMRPITKIRQDNDVTDHIGVISIEYDTELSRLIGYFSINDEDEYNNKVTNNTSPLYAKDN